MSKLDINGILSTLKGLFGKIPDAQVSVGQQSGPLSGGGLASLLPKGIQLTDTQKQYRPAPTTTPTPTMAQQYTAPQAPVKTIKEWYDRGYDKKYPESTATLPTATPTPTMAPGQIKGFKTWNPPQNYSQMVIDEATKRGIHPALLAAHIQSESGFRPDAYNTGLLEDGRTVKARGIAQITDLFHPDVTDAQAYDPAFAIPYAANMLADSYKKRQNWEQTSASYYVGNRIGKGPGRDERGLGPEARKYLNKIVKNLDEQTIQELGLLSSYAE
jgi:soluble lytic murein transglycosylase-like protein